jgi:hypothetical protein
MNTAATSEKQTTLVATPRRACVEATARLLRRCVNVSLTEIVFNGTTYDRATTNSFARHVLNCGSTIGNNKPSSGSKVWTDGFSCTARF